MQERVDFPDTPRRRFASNHRGIPALRSEFWLSQEGIWVVVRNLAAHVLEVWIYFTGKSPSQNVFFLAEPIFRTGDATCLMKIDNVHFFHETALWDVRRFPVPAD